MATTLFHGRRFYLTRTIAPQQRQQVRELIEERGGEVTSNLRGAIQLVDQEHLDPRQDWVSVDFVLDSVARGALQDLSDYMGAELAPASPVREEPPRRPQASHNRRQKRIKYSVEDDARMLLYLQARSNFGRLNKSMESVPLSVWEHAARKKVTNHTGQSMHERYRKQLRTKTLAERREIISKGLKKAKARAAEGDEEEKDEEMDEIEDETEDEDDAPAPAAAPAPTAISTITTEQPRSPPAATPAGRPPTPPVARDTGDQTSQAAQSDSRPPDRHSSSDSSSEDDEEGDTRARKRLRRSTLQKEPSRPSETTFASPSESAAVPSPRRSLRRQSSPVLPLGRPPLHRESNRRQTLGVVTRSSSRGAGIKPPIQPSRSSSEEDEEEEKEEEEEEKEEEEEEKGGEEQEAQEDQEVAPTRASDSGDPRDERGVFFSSVWATAFADPSNRRRLHDLFEPAELSSPTRTLLRVAESPAESSPPSASRGVSPPSDSASPVTAPADPASPSSVRTTPELQQRSPESDATATPQTSRKRSLSDADIGQQTPPESERQAEVDQTSPRSEPPAEVEYSTERELDALLFRIQFETKANLQTIVHALYYSSGDYATAKAFLKGQSPAGMWSPQDDLLLASLMNEATTRADVEAAARDGTFAAMRVQRGAGDILARIRYLL